MQLPNVEEMSAAEKKWFAQSIAGMVVADLLGGRGRLSADHRLRRRGDRHEQGGSTDLCQLSALFPVFAGGLQHRFHCRAGAGTTAGQVTPGNQPANAGW